MQDCVLALQPMKMPTCILFGLCVLLAVSGAADVPCCTTCETGKEKYYSIPEPDVANAQCGECCLQPSRYEIWKVFEPKLLKGDCASQGFTKYKSTETDGLPPMAVTNDRYIRPSECPQKLQAVYADMHDGDQKEITISGTSLTIKPHGNNQTWIVKAELDTKGCFAIIDFRVPGKPGPPPVNLTAALWYSVSTGKVKKTEFEFFDSSGTLPAGPLNRWVQLDSAAVGPATVCPKALKAVYADMHDGDMKEVTVSDGSMTIKPSGNNQTWVVKSTIEPNSCSAVIDFNVPGKPNPPPINLTVALLTTYSAAEEETRATELEFTDPSGKLAAARFPLNHWVEVKKEEFGQPVIIL